MQQREPEQWELQQQRPRQRSPSHLPDAVPQRPPQQLPQRREWDQHHAPRSPCRAEWEGHLPPRSPPRSPQRRERQWGGHQAWMDMPSYQQYRPAAGEEADSYSSLDARAAEEEAAEEAWHLHNVKQQQRRDSHGGGGRGGGGGGSSWGGGRGDGGGGGGGTPPASPAKHTNSSRASPSHDWRSPPAAAGAASHVQRIRGTGSSMAGNLEHLERFADEYKAGAGHSF